jgi:hypothetical protein
MDDPTTRSVWEHTGAWRGQRRFAARIVRRQRFGVGLGVRLVGPHDDYPAAGGHFWVYGSVGRFGFGMGTEPSYE